MNRISKSFALATLVGAVAATAVIVDASGADAHAIWFAQRAKQLAFIYGIGGDDLDSVKRLPLVKSVTGYDAQYRPVPTRLRVDGPMVMVDSDAPLTVVTAVMPYGIWSKQPDGEWVRKGRDEVPNALMSTKNFKYTVRIEGPLAAPMPAFPDQVLQIQPVSPTLPQKMDQPMRLRVLLHGKPIAGASVLADMVNDPDSPPLKTGRDGTVVIRVRNQGLNVVNAVYDGPSDEPAKAARIEHEATLSFVLPHAPE